jgi:hypothetical protein
MEEKGREGRGEEEVGLGRAGRERRQAGRQGPAFLPRPSLSPSPSLSPRLLRLEGPENTTQPPRMPFFSLLHISVQK